MSLYSDHKIKQPIHFRIITVDSYTLKILYNSMMYCQRVYTAKISSQLGSTSYINLFSTHQLSWSPHISIVAYICTFTIYDSGIVKGPGSSVLPLYYVDKLIHKLLYSIVLKYSIKAVSWPFIESSYATAP